MSETVTPACLFCQKALQGKRRHAAYCSSRCRVYASRKRYSLRESVTVSEPEKALHESVTAESVTPESVTPESVTLPHVRYWLDSKGQRWCSDCFPPVVGVALHDVTATFNDEHYQDEERLGIQDG